MMIVMMEVMVATAQTEVERTVQIIASAAVTSATATTAAEAVIT